MKLPRLISVTLAGLVIAGASLNAQVTNQNLLNAAQEPQNWLTYSGTYSSQRYSTLNQITPSNVKDLRMQWVFQADSLQKMEASPIVVNGVMYVTQAPNDVVALDARTGRVFWEYQYDVSPEARLCCGRVNRGLAIHGNTLFMGTLDGHLVALDATNGRVVWNILIADPKLGYSITEAPLVVKDEVVVGPAGGEYGIRGFIAAYDVATGKELWKFYTVPGPGEPGHDTWAGNSWEHGGASTWTTGSYDPELNTIYWGTGNPGPDWNSDSRAGDNLYSCSMIALDATTGKLKWHYQTSPHDTHDWDAVNIPVLATIDWKGSPRKVLLFASRNGYFYVLDRTTGKLLLGKAFVRETWTKGLDANGHPIPAPNSESTIEGVKVYPGMQGGTNWYSPSWSPRTGLFYLSAWKDYFSSFSKLPDDYVPGQSYFGGATRSVIPPIRRGDINNWTNSDGHGAVMAIDPGTGDPKWTFDMYDVTDSGILTTASDVLFTGSREGFFWALDARTGKPLWHATTGGQISSAPVTYTVDGKQYVAISANHAVFAFALP
jgi:alcohol dehydrogenase (cytochrome c)